MANSNLTHTASTGNQKTWTFSAWVKKNNLGSNAYLYSQGSSGSNYIGIYFGTSDEFKVYNEVSSSQTLYFVTTRKFRDISAWYHVVVQCDTTQATQGDRFKIWINGVQETSFSSASYPAQNSDTNMNVNSSVQRIGVYNASGSNPNHYFDGYMSHVALVDGSVVAPTTFGSTDSTSGIWKFKSPSGVTWGTNGFHLKFENSGALGTDSSGQSNTFAVNGNLKQALDTPSNVYCTINPLYRMDLSNNATLSNGNNTFSSDQSGYNIRYGTLGVNKGKWYYEAKFISFSPETSPGMPFGISASQIPAGAQTAGYALYDYSYNYDGSNSTVQVNNSATNYGTTPLNAVGQIGMCAFDLDNNKVYFGVNGVWTNSGNPAGNANGFTIADPDNTELGFYFPSTADRSSNRSYVYSFNFGNGFFGTTAITSAGSNGNGSLFEYDVPSGYYALNTKNINTYG